MKDTRRLFRTDFFPGLGWMLRRQLWEQELRWRTRLIRPPCSKLVCTGRRIEIYTRHGNTLEDLLQPVPHRFKALVEGMGVPRK